jgi:hypothetical protein
MNTENISKHVSTVSTEALADMAAGQWDEVMTDALYAACGAETVDEMTSARSIAEATAWVLSHSDDDNLDEQQLEAAFAAIFERPATDEDREQGLWSHLCAAVAAE